MKHIVQLKLSEPEWAFARSLNQPVTSTIRAAWQEYCAKRVTGIPAEVEEMLLTIKELETAFGGPFDGSPVQRLLFWAHCMNEAKLAGKAYLKRMGYKEAE